MANLSKIKEVFENYSENQQVNNMTLVKIVDDIGSYISDDEKIIVDGIIEIYSDPKKLQINFVTLDRIYSELETNLLIYNEYDQYLD
ncbi:hypothetical protein HOA59_02815 [archaeon]|jgi:hypothetical protein|nr:hypothetical protein [archaeon]MBT6824342.1 hypothetical protein [archaeon]MBT7106892.1 hypothetical protein [archaeon]MBT7297445.1 hypothetical protein [archaeon]